MTECRNTVFMMRVRVVCKSNACWMLVRPHMAHAGNGLVDVVTKLARLLAGEERRGEERDPLYIKLRETPTTPISSIRDGVPKST